MMDEMGEQSSFNFEQLWAIVRRGRWWILLPLFACWFAAWAVSWLLPATYQSEALILIEQQKVPEHYVLSNVSVNLEERLQSITQQILSRTRLEQIVDRYHLYAGQNGWRRVLDAGDPVEQMRKDIKIDLVQPQGKPADLTAFKISYAAGSAEVAQQVNNMLTEQFIDESLNAQRQLSQSTTSFLDNQLVAAATELEKQEQEVRAFKTSHLGDLPSQLQSNVEILSGLQNQLQNTQHALDVAKQQKLYLESQLQQLRTSSSFVGDGPSELDSLQKQLLDLRNKLADDRARHTEEFPDIVALKRKIAATEKLIKDLEHSAATDDQQKASARASDASADATYPIVSSPFMQIRSQLKANELEIENYRRMEKGIEGKIAEYRSRLNLTPATEQELAEKSRGYEEAKANYNSLVQKKNQSQLATNLENRQEGQQFRVLDPPSLPGRPKSPNHLLLSLGGLAAGGLLGVCLLAFRELTNPRVQHEDDIDGLVPARILVRIPHLDTPQDLRLSTRSRLLEAVAVLCMALVMIAGNLYAFLKG
jgi:polysaccharide chain length determinant protein (PEP-CTERM system associated)